MEKYNKSFGDLVRKFVVPHWKWYVAGVITLALTNYIMLEIPDRSKHVINGLVSQHDVNELEIIVISIIVLGFMQMIIRSLSRILMFWPGRKIESEIKDYYFARFLKLPESFLNRYGMGDLISRLANDVNHIRICFAFAALQVFNLVFLTIFTVHKMISVHWQLTLYAMLPISLMAIVTKIGMPKIHLYSVKSQEAMSHLTNYVTEAFVNAHVIQLNGAKASFIDRIEQGNKEVFDTNLKLTVVRTIVFPLMVLFTGLSYVVVLFYGGHEVTSGRLTVGDIMAFNVYIGFLTFPLTAIGIVISILQRTKAAAQRLAELEDNEVEQGHVKQFPHVEVNQPILEIKNLSYQFEKDQVPIINQLNLQVFPGERVGIAGKVGSGKSTLFKLITKLIEPPRGTIFWRGVDVLDIEPDELRHQIGFATQTVHLFSDTIANNLIFGTVHKEVNEAVKEAARKAMIIDDIEGFDKGWQTEIGEKGVRLSGGQKQRLALARIFLRTPSMYLLDDVTSALDHTTEQKVISYIHQTHNALMIASHRASALQDCNKVILLHEGGILISGPLPLVKEQFPEAFLAE